MRVMMTMGMTGMITKDCRLNVSFVGEAAFSVAFAA